MTLTDELREPVYAWIRAVPAGKVVTYGQLAGLAGSPAHSRVVGRILSQLPSGSTLPWYRVVASGGRIASPNAVRQAELLRAEGVWVTNGRVRLKSCQWVP